MNQTERIIGSEILRKLPYEPNSQQMEIIAALSKFVADTDGRSVFLLNGYAGTGKTSLAGALVAALPALRRQAVLLAPTGRAAKVFAAYSRSPYTAKSTKADATTPRTRISALPATTTRTRCLLSTRRR